MFPLSHLPNALMIAYLSVRESAAAVASSVVNGLKIQYVRFYVLGFV